MLLLAAVLIGWLLMAGEQERFDPVLLPVGYLGGVALAGGLVLLAFGVLMRTAHRWFYLASRDSLLPYFRITVRDRFTTWFDAKFWRWWLHIDLSGNDRDA